jgi:hypothetical protein
VGYSRDPDSNQDGASPPGSDASLENFARRTPMMDVVMLAIAFAFFALSIAYVYACERL